MKFIIKKEAKKYSDDSKWGAERLWFDFAMKIARKYRLNTQ
jgi:hypothetical protein